MAITQNTYTGNGSTVLFSFTFPYLETTDIKVSVNGTTTTAYTLANATTIQFNTAPVSGAAIRIYRQTDDANLQANFYPGSAIRSSDLNDNFTQNLYVTQESNRQADLANQKADLTATVAAGAVTTSNTALSQSAAAVSTANTASSNASASVTTSNAAAASAAAAVSTANTASTTASSAVTTANSAVTTANTKGDAAIASAASANTTAAGAVSTANAATTTANSAVNTANTKGDAAIASAATANTTAASAVTTANSAVTIANTKGDAAIASAATANTNASAAVSTANTASTNASTAVTTANTANSKADQAIAVVGSSVLYDLVSNVAAIPASPTNNKAVEIFNSTGIESFTPLTGRPAGFVGSAGLSARIIYTTSGATWNWVQYFPNDPETRYLKLGGGTLTGPLTLAGAPTTGLQPATKTYVDAADATLTTAAAAAQSTANTAVTNAATAQTTANAAVVRAGDTMTGALAHPLGAAATPSITFTGDLNTGIYSPGADQVALATNGTGRLTVDTAATTSTLPVVHPLGAAATPSLTFTGDLNTGFWSPTADTLAASTAGSERLRITSAGLVGVGTSSPGTIGGGAILNISPAGGGRIVIGSPNRYFYITGASGTEDLRFGRRITSDTADSDIFTINGSTGNVGIGTTSPGAALHVSNGNDSASGEFIGLVLGGTNPGNARTASLIKDTTTFDLIYRNNNFSSVSGSHVFRNGNSEHARIDSSGRLLVGTSSTSKGDCTLLLQGNANGTSNAGVIVLARGEATPTDGLAIGQVQFTDNTHTSAGSASLLAARDGGTWSGSSKPTRLVFSTTADGASSPTERMRISSTGAVTFTGAVTIPAGASIKNYATLAQSYFFSSF